MSKMSSYDPFEHLKHKLWSKERSGIKLGIWLWTTKSQESTRFTCVQVACHIPLESSWQGLQLCFKPHINPRFTEKVMGAQRRKNPKGKMPFGCGPVEKHIIYYKGEGDGFPQVRAMVNLVNPSCPWFVLAPKMLKPCTNHLVLVLCKSVWEVEACQFFLISSWSSSMPLYPSKVLRTRERAPTPCSSIIFCLGLTFESLEELKTCQIFKANDLEDKHGKVCICKIGAMGHIMFQFGPYLAQWFIF
jgi:hypothetical protein